MFEKKSDKKSFFKKRSRFSKQGFSKSPSSSHSRFGSKKRNNKTFDPSMFVKKVEELTVSVQYVAKNSFTTFEIHEQIKKNIVNRGYEQPTQIQDEIIPHILSGRDVIASANTGTGKTAAFLVPLISNVLTQKNQRVLIIAPTRELAEQIQKEFVIFAAHTQLKSALCIGGVNILHQIKRIRQKPDFIIGTPGRLLDLSSQGVLRFSAYDAIVLDEVDRMLDMGFITDITSIISALPEKRTSLFFSATIPANMKELMSSFLVNPVTVRVQTRESAQNVSQDVIRVTQQNKIDFLHDSLIKSDFKKGIVFLRTKRTVEKLSKVLQERGFVVSSI